MTFEEHVALMKESENYKHHYYLFEMLEEHEGIKGSSLDEMYERGYMLAISKIPCYISCEYTETLLEKMYEITLVHETEKSYFVGYDVYVVSISKDISLLERDLNFVIDRSKEHKTNGHDFAVKMYDDIVRLLRNKIRRYKRAC